MLNLVCNVLQLNDEQAKQDLGKLLQEIQLNNFYNTNNIKAYSFAQFNWESLLHHQDPEDNDLDFFWGLTKNEKQIANCIYFHLVFFPRVKTENRNPDVKKNQENSVNQPSLKEAESPVPPQLKNTGFPTTTNNNTEEIIKKEINKKTNNSGCFSKFFSRFIRDILVLGISGYGIYQLLKQSDSTMHKPISCLFPFNKIIPDVLWPSSLRESLIIPLSPFSQTKPPLEITITITQTNDQKEDAGFQQIETTEIFINPEYHEVVPINQSVGKSPTRFSLNNGAITHILGTSLSLTILVGLATFFGQNELKKKQMIEFEEQNKKSGVRNILRMCAVAVAAVTTTYLIYLHFS